MSRVALASDLSFQIAFGNALSMNPGLVSRIHLCMAAPTGFGDVCLVGGAQRIVAAEDMVRSVAALAIGRDQQSFLAERKAVDRVYIQRINAGQPMLLRHALLAVTCAAGTRNVERIDRGPGIALGEDGMCVSMTTGAWMILAIRMDATDQSACFIRVTGLAADRSHLVRVRVVFDRRVAIVAFQNAVDARCELARVHSDVVSRRILHRRVGVAG